MDRKFLVTRETEAAFLTKIKFKKLGLDVTTFPLSKITKLNVSLANSDNISAVIFTSKNAFKIRNYNFWREYNKKYPFLIIGKSFAELLIHSAIYNFRYFNSVEELRHYLSYNLINKNFLYLRGEKISYDLKKSLNHNIRETICYKTQYKNIGYQEIITFIDKNNITDLLFFSELNSKHFLNIFTNNTKTLNKYNIYCLSSKIAKIFKKQEIINRVFYPQTPNIDKLLDIIN